MGEEIHVNIQKGILERKLQVWNNTLYDASVDQRIADKIGDENMQKQAVSNMKKAHKAIDALRELLDELNKDSGTDE